MDKKLRIVELIAVFVFFCAYIGFTFSLMDNDVGTNIFSKTYRNFESTKTTITTTKSYFDDSEKSLGYVRIYTPANTRILITVNGEQKALMQSKEYTDLFTITLAYSDGDYKFTGVNEANETVFEYETTVTGLDENVFTYPSTYVDYESSSYLKKNVIKNYNNTKDNKSFAKYMTSAVYHWMSYSTIDKVDENYITDIDNVLYRQYGLCVDYATVYCASMRMVDIPCKVIYGYLDSDEYHAWCEVFIDGEWIIIDPTNNNYDVSPKIYDAQKQF